MIHIRLVRHVPLKRYILHWSGIVAHHDQLLVRYVKARNVIEDNVIDVPRSGVEGHRANAGTVVRTVSIVAEIADHHIMGIDPQDGTGAD